MDYLSEKRYFFFIKGTEEVKSSSHKSVAANTHVGAAIGFILGCFSHEIDSVAGHATRWMWQTEFQQTRVRYELVFYDLCGP